MPLQPIDRNFWIGRKFHVAFRTAPYQLTSAASKGDMVIDVSEGSVFEAGTQAGMITPWDSEETIDIEEVNGDTLKLKKGLNRSYDSGDTVNFHHALIDEHKEIVDIKATEVEQDVQIKYGDYKDKVSGGDWGAEDPALEVKGQLEKKESFTVTGKIINSYMPVDMKEDALRRYALRPMVRFKYRFGDVRTGIIDKIKITDNQTIVRKDEHYSNDFKSESRDVKMKITAATKK